MWWGVINKKFFVFFRYFTRCPREKEKEKRTKRSEKIYLQKKTSIRMKFMNLKINI